MSKIILLRKKEKQRGTLKQSQEKKHSYKTKHTQNVIKTNIANKKKTTNNDFDFFIFVESMAVVSVFFSSFKN